MMSTTDLKPSPPETDAIDLKDAVGVLWDTRWAVMVALAGFLSAFALVNSTIAVIRGYPARWNATIELSFPGAENDLYPNGRPFSPSDLLGPQVLARVFDRSGLSEFGVSREEFTEGLSISSSPPALALLLERYQRRLDAAGLDQVAREAIEQELADELARAGRLNQRLSLTLSISPLPWANAPPSPLVMNTLLDIPRQWAVSMMEERGAFATIGLRHSGGTIEGLRSTQGDPTVLREFLKGQFRLLRDDVEAMRTAIAPRTARDPQSGLGIADLQFQIDELEMRLINSISIASGDPQLQSSTPAGRAFLGWRVESLESERDLWLAKSTIVEQALQDERRRTDSRPARGADLPNEPGLLGLSSSIPQLGSDFLDRVIQLGTESNASDFRESLVRAKLDYLKEAETLQSQIDQYREQLNNFVDEDEDPSRVAESTRSGDVELGERIAPMTQQLRELFKLANRLAAQAAEFRLGTIDPPYASVIAAEQAELPSLLPDASQKRLLASGSLAAGFAAVLASIGRRMLRSRSQSNSTA